MGELATTVDYGEVSGAANHEAPAGRSVLRDLFILRCFSVAETVAIVLVATLVYQLALPLPQVLTGVVAMAVFAAYTAFLAKRGHALSEFRFFLHLVLDLQMISYLLYWCGGDANPFRSLYFVPLTIAAVNLRWVYVGMVTVVTFADYAFLNVFGELGSAMVNGGAVPASVFQVAADTAYLLTGGQIAYFVTRLAATARGQAAALAAARVQQANDRLVTGFATLAAGAAHEMATPMAVIALLVKEIRAGREEAGPGLDTIARQVNACKQTLRHLSQMARPGQGKGEASIPLDQFLDAIAHRFQALRPNTVLETDWALPSPLPAVREDAALTQSVITLLNNAADASPQPVHLHGCVRNDMLVLEVTDHGPGIPPGLAQRLGQPFVTTKGPMKGMGMGLFLAKTSVERLGGTLEFFARPEGGTRVALSVPITTLQE